ncbi:lamin-like protein [Senna tora]|uniref:Lamin-like protein n=1 Tax=Senna tora TaxID=362788 RepID=A0A834SFN7_9FABA|nr:lamin-like protein [Senna tora]
MGLGGPVLHKVGGSKGWTHDEVNYTQWAAQQHFSLGDWLLFNFDKRYYTVLEVNETSYEKCIDQGFIRNLTRGGRDVVQLAEPRTYYFLSSGGYCFHGMKLAVTVPLGEYRLYPQPQAPAPSPADTSATHRLSCYTAKQGIIISLPNVIYVMMLLLWGIIIM